MDSIRLLLSMTCFDKPWRRKEKRSAWSIKPSYTLLYRESEETVEVLA
jgi:hypothetical protein